MLLLRVVTLARAADGGDSRAGFPPSLWLPLSGARNILSFRQVPCRLKKIVLRLFFPSIYYEILFVL